MENSRMENSRDLTLVSMVAQDPATGRHLPLGSPTFISHVDIRPGAWTRDSGPVSTSHNYGDLCTKSAVHDFSTSLKLVRMSATKSLALDDIASVGTIYLYVPDTGFQVYHKSTDNYGKVKKSTTYIGPILSRLGSATRDPNSSLYVSQDCKDFEKYRELY